jgi:hypothetical protein
MKTPARLTFAHFLMAIALGSIATSALPAQEYVRDSEPRLFSYDELVELSKDQAMSHELAEKLRLVTTTPFINNEAYLGGARAKPLGVATLGPSLRVAFWNIERGSSKALQKPIQREKAQSHQ